MEVTGTTPLSGSERVKLTNAGWMLHRDDKDKNRDTGVWTRVFGDGIRVDLVFMGRGYVIEGFRALAGGWTLVLRKRGEVNGQTAEKFNASAERVAAALEHPERIGGAK